MVFESRFLRKTFLVGVMLLCATLMADLMGQAKLTLMLSKDDGVADMAQLKSYGLFVRLGILALFFMAYRRNILDKVLRRATEAMVLVSLFVLFLGGSVVPAWLHKVYFLGAEAWSSFFMAFLFWAFANQSFSMDEASIAYPFLLFIPLTISKPLVHFFSEFVSDPNLDVMLRSYGWALVVVWLLFACAATVLSAYKIGTYPLEEKKSALTKVQEWRYLGCVFAIVASFGVCARVMESLFKQVVVSHFKTPVSYIPFMESYTTYLSIGGVVLFVLTFWMVRALGWMKSALVTPLFVFAATVVLSICVHQTFSGALDAQGLVQLVVALSVLLKGLGVLYLTTKEMAYIPLRATTRVYAKGTLEFAGFALYTLVVTTFPVRIGTGEGYNYPILLLFVASAVWCAAVVILSKIMRSGANT